MRHVLEHMAQRLQLNAQCSESPVLEKMAGGGEPSSDLSYSTSSSVVGADLEDASTWKCPNFRPEVDGAAWFQGDGLGLAAKLELFRFPLGRSRRVQYILLQPWMWWETLAWVPVWNVEASVANQKSPAWQKLMAGCQRLQLGDRSQFWIEVSAIVLRKNWCQSLVLVCW